MLNWQRDPTPCPPLGFKGLGFRGSGFRGSGFRVMVPCHAKIGSSSREEFRLRVRGPDFY